MVIFEQGVWLSIIISITYKLAYSAFTYLLKPVFFVRELSVMSMHKLSMVSGGDGSSATLRSMLRNKVKQFDSRSFPSVSTVC